MKLTLNRTQFTKAQCSKNVWCKNSENAERDDGNDGGRVERMLTSKVKHFLNTVTRCLKSPAHSFTHGTSFPEGVLNSFENGFGNTFIPTSSLGNDVLYGYIKVVTRILCISESTKNGIAGFLSSDVLMLRCEGGLLIEEELLLINELDGAMSRLVAISKVPFSFRRYLHAE